MDLNALAFGNAYLNALPPLGDSDIDFPVSVGGMHRPILIVEDTTMAACLTQAMLAHQGLESAIAFGGQEALQWLDENDATVVLCDISMPGMNGIDLARAIRARSPTRQPILIAYTAYTREHERRVLLNAGFDDYIAKPVRADQLAGAIRKWLG